MSVCGMSCDGPVIVQCKIRDAVLMFGKYPRLTTIMRHLRHHCIV